MVELMTLEEAAQYLRVTKKTIYRLLTQGKIPAMKVGKQWRFKRGVIDEWLQRSAVGAQANLLVIDDEEIIRLLFRDVLEESGHRVMTAGNSIDGLALAQEEEFDLVFLDLKLPGMDGADLFGEIRKAKPELPVVIITGYPDSEMMARALAFGPLGVMSKPFGDVEINDAVNAFLHISSANTS